MIWWILISGLSFGAVITYAGIPREVVALVGGLGISPWLILILIQVVLLILGCFLESGTIILVILPMFWPIVDALGFNLVWFGVLFVIMAEMGTDDD